MDKNILRAGDACCQNVKEKNVYNIYQLYLVCPLVLRLNSERNSFELAHSISDNSHHLIEFYLPPKSIVLDLPILIMNMVNKTEELLVFLN